MVLSKEKMNELEKASEPLIKWLNENCHPHVQVNVDCGSAQLFEGVARVKNEKYIRD